MIIYTKARPLWAFRLLLFALCALLALQENTIGQTIQSISGNVVYDSNEPAFGNVLVLSPQDSTIITGTSFISGRFELSGLQSASVLLKFTSLAFKDKFIPIVYESKSQIELGTIVVSPASVSLEDIVVVAEAPFVIQKPDGSVTLKVANTTLATSTSTEEILSKSPGVLVNENGEISIFGKGMAVVFIDGVRVDNQYLSALSPTLIESIEIITNPGPRYDAEGNAVINVITKKNQHEGTMVVLKNYYSYSRFAGYDNRTNLDLSYKKRKWSVNGSYGLLIGKDRWLKETTRTRDRPADFFNSDIRLDWLYDRSNFSNYTLGSQFNLSDGQYISLEYNGAFEAMGGDQLSENMITADNTGAYQSFLEIDDLNQKNVLNLNYAYETDSLGSTLFIGSQYAHYQNTFDNDIRSSSLVNEVETIADIKNPGEGTIQILSTQVDVRKVYGQGLSLEVGGKLSYVNNRSVTDFFDLQANDVPLRDERLSNTFQYDEWVPAAYLNLGKQVGDHAYGLGFRMELTDYRLITSVGEGADIKDKYVSFFPYASYSGRLSSVAGVFLTYASRILRPSYAALNPFIIYQDEFTSIRGNSGLQPSNIHSLEVGATYGDWTLKSGYTYTLDRMSRAAFQAEGDPREYVLQSVNFDNEHAYFASLSKGVNHTWWKSTNTFSVNYSKLIDDTGIFEVRESRPSYYLYSQNTFQVKEGFRFFLTAWYASSVQDGIYFRNSQGSLNLGIEKKFMNDALQCNFDINDVFHTIRADGFYRSGDTNIVFANTWNTSHLRFSLSYNFGRLKQLSYRNKKVAEAESNRLG